MANTIAEARHDIVGGNKLVGEIYIRPDIIIWRKSHGQKYHTLTLKQFRDFIEKQGKATKTKP